MYIIYNEEGPNSNELGPSSYYLYCTQHMQAPSIRIKYAFIIILTHKRLNNG
nr:MAG TPA: hypothetical protein [Caudoviricetes sp.]